MDKSETLSQKVVRGSTWQIGIVIAQIISNLIGVVILARLIDPAEYGVFVAIQVVAGIVTLFSNFGIASALVQCKEVTPKHIEVGFTSSLVLGFAVFIILWFLAPLLPSLFNSSFNISMVRVNALVFPILGWSMVSATLLTRKLDFKSLFFSNIVSTFIGSNGITIFFAYLGFGTWSLVIGTVASAIITTISLSILSPHSRRIGLPKKEVRDLFSFGGMYTTLRIINYFSNKADNFIVGRWMGVEALGLYDRSFQIMSYPGAYIGNIIDSVSFPALAKIQDETSKLRRAYLDGIKLANFILIPWTVFFVIYADEIVRVLLGQKWLEVTPTLQILFLGVTFRTTSRVCDSLARAKGALIQNTNQKIIYLLLVVFGSFLGKKFGLIGVAVGVDFAVLIHYLLMANLGLKLTNGDVREFVLAHKSGIGFMFIFIIICYPLSSFLRHLSLSPLFILLVSFVSVVVVAFLLAFSFPKLIDKDILYWIDVTAKHLKIIKIFGILTKNKLHRTEKST